MLQLYAIVIDGVVWTVTELDTKANPDWKPPFGGIAVLLDPQSPVSVGYTYDGKQFTPPIPPQPESVMPTIEAVLALFIQKNLITPNDIDTLLTIIPVDDPKPKLVSAQAEELDAVS